LAISKSPHADVHFSENHIRLIVVVILCFYPLVGMGIDLITPSLPTISHALHSSTHFAKNLITLYLLGYAFGNLIIGFLSDTLGRRHLMCAGFFIFILASLLPTFFEKPSVLLFSRLLQGFTIAAFGVIGRAVLSDVLPKEKLIQYATLISTMWGIGPIIGPLIGGYLQFYFNWQACFYFFAFMGFLGFLASLFIIPETHFIRQTFQLQQIKQNLITIISHRLFLGSVLLMGIAYSLLIAFNTLGPFLIQTSFGYSPVFFAHVALVLGIFYLCSSFLCRYYLKRFSAEDILGCAIRFFLLIAVVSYGLSLLDPNNIWALIVPSLLMFVACGTIYPVCMGKGLSLFRHLAGSGSAIMSFVNVLITSFTALLMSFLHTSNAVSVNLIYLGLMLAASLVYFFLLNRPSST